MSISDTMLFLDTENADRSLWMCWELGWFDGEKGPLGILPMLPDGQRFIEVANFSGSTLMWRLTMRVGSRLSGPL